MSHTAGLPHPGALLMIQDGGTVRFVRFSGARPVLLCEAQVGEAVGILEDALDARAYDRVVMMGPVCATVVPALRARGVAYGYGDETSTDSDRLSA
jgi:hypothetical protein